MEDSSSSFCIIPLCSRIIVMPSFFWTDFLWPSSVRPISSPLNIAGHAIRQFSCYPITRSSMLMSVTVDRLEWPRSLQSVWKPPFRSLPRVAIETSCASGGLWVHEWSRVTCTNMDSGAVPLWGAAFCWLQEGSWRPFKPELIANPVGVPVPIKVRIGCRYTE